MKYRTYIVMAAVALSVALSACDIFDSDTDPEPHCGCTAVFAMVRFWVVDSSGQPQEHFGLTITNTRTDELYDVDQTYARGGEYIAIDDSFRRKIRGDGDSLLVHGAEGERGFDAYFVVDVPGECRCHIHKVSGPDTVVVAEKKDG